MRIYLLRHGIAEDARPGQPDSARALTAEGKEKLRQVMKRSRVAGVSPTLVLSSPYKRALETAEIAADVLGYKDEIERTESLVPEANPQALWDEIRARKDQDEVLLASHEPLMSSATAFLLDAPGLQVDMKKAAVVRVDCERFGTRPHGVLKWMITPAVCGE